MCKMCKKGSIKVFSGNIERQILLQKTKYQLAQKNPGYSTGLEILENLRKGGVVKILL